MSEDRDHFHLVEPSDKLLQDYRPTRKGLSTIFVLKQQRIAWHSTWISQYSADSFGFSPESLYGVAERKRTQGTHLSIFSAPLIFLTNGSTIIGAFPIGERSKTGYDRLICVLESNKDQPPLPYFPHSNSRWIRLFVLKGRPKTIKGFIDKRFDSDILPSGGKLWWRESHWAPRNSGLFVDLLYRRLRVF